MELLLMSLHHRYVLFDLGAYVASVGGSAGLFLGLSLMDAVEWIGIWYQKMKG